MEKNVDMGMFNLEIKGSDDLDFSEHWNLLHDVISQGEKLREQKPRPSPREYDVININFIKKPKKCFKTYRKFPNRQSQNDTCYTKPLSMQNFLHRNFYSKLPSSSQERKPKPKLKNKIKCPMRVMELAEPSKRQCLETLREKCHSLPDFMLDRLRMQLRDQKPVVHITDAINCFKIKNSCKQRPKMQTKEVESKSFTEMKYFCAIFGTLVAKRLQKSVRTEDLGDQMQRLSKIVSGDIKRIMFGRKNRRIAKVRYCNNNMNLQDAARKVAIWIGLILEDSAEKMLEEELRELEEEEGPVLDFLDDVLDTVLVICEPHLPKGITSSSSSDHFDDAVDGESSRGEDEKEATLGDNTSIDITTEDTTSKDSDNVDILIDNKTEDATKDMTIDLLTEKNDLLIENIVSEMISIALQNAIQSESEKLQLMGLFNKEDTLKDPDSVSINTVFDTNEKPELSEKVSEPHFTQSKQENDTKVEANHETEIKHDFTKNISKHKELPVTAINELVDQNDSYNVGEITNEIGSSQSMIQDTNSQQNFIKKFLEDTKDIDIDNQETNDFERKVENQDNLKEVEPNKYENQENIKGDAKKESIQEPDKIVTFDENNEHYKDKRKTSSSKSREQILHAHKHTVRRLVAHNIGATVSIQSMSWARSLEHMPPNVQPPNEHLLNVVDEKWPSHIMPFQSSQALDLVKKSVTSLGRIFEQEPFLGVHGSGGSDQYESFIGEFQWIEEGPE